MQQLAPSSTYLQHYQSLWIVLVQSNIKSRFIKLAESVDISPVSDEQLYDVSVVVLCRPVQSRHFQHVLGIYISPVLKEISVTRLGAVSSRRLKGGACASIYTGTPTLNPEGHSDQLKAMPNLLYSP